MEDIINPQEFSKDIFAWFGFLIQDHKTNGNAFATLIREYSDNVRCKLCANFVEYHMLNISKERDGSFTYVMRNVDDRNDTKFYVEYTKKEA